MQKRDNQPMQQVPGGAGAPRGSKVSSKEFAAKYRSKREIYSKCPS
jgi:hypothetical protein